jgi:hypothetical protein
MERGDDSTFARLSCQDSRNSGRAGGMARRERKLRLASSSALGVLANRIDSGHLKGDPEIIWAIERGRVVRLGRCQIRQGWHCSTDSLLPLY